MNEREQWIRRSLAVALGGLTKELRAVYLERGLSDDELLEAIERKWRGRVGGCGRDYGYSTWPGPSIEIYDYPDGHHRQSYAVLKGPRLLALVREVTGVGLPVPAGQMRLL